MEDEKKTKKQLIEELSELRQSVAELKGSAEDIYQAKVNHEKFAKAFLQNSIPVTITTLKEGRFVDVSDAFLRLMGRKRGEVVGHTSIEIGFITEDQRESFFDELNKRGRVENLEMKVRTKDRVLRDGLFNAVMMSINNEKYLLTVMTDITERKRIEDTLRESEAKYRLLIDTANESIMVVQDGQIKLVNPMAIGLLGGDSEQELIYRAFPEFVHSDDRDMVVTNYRRRIAKEAELPRYAFRLVSRDGIVKWVELNATLIEWQGKPATLNLFTDITERKQVEQDLIKHQNLLNTIIDSASEAIFAKDTDGRYNAINEAGARMLGFRATDMIGHTDIELLPAEMAREFRKTDEYVMLSGLTYEREEIVVIGGKPRIFLAHKAPWRDESDKIIGVIGVSNDITERKLAEEALRESEERWKSALEGVGDGVWDWNFEANKVFYSPQYKAMLGYVKEDLSDSFEEWEKRVHPDDKKQCLKDFQGHWNGKANIYRNEHRVLCKDGTYKWVLARGKIIQWTEDGKPRRAIGTHADLTDRKRVEEELERHRRHLESMVKDRTAELEAKNMTLQELNTTLKVLLKQREEDKKDMEERFVMNIRNLILPYVEQMKKGNLDVGQQAYLGIIEAHLHEIATPLLKNMRHFNLTPKEIKVAALVKQGKSTKEIAELLRIASGSIDVHRKNIRGKLGLNNKKANLQSHLESLEQ